MRMTARQFLLIPALFVCALANADEAKDRKNEHDPWHGFPKGSAVVITEISQQGDVEQQKTTKAVRTGGVLGDSTISLFREKDGQFAENPDRQSIHVDGLLPSEMPGAKLTAKRTDSLVIDETKFQCDVEEYRGTKPAKQQEAVFVIWRCKNVVIPYRELAVDGPDMAMPPNVLRAECTIKKPGRSESTVVEVVSFKAQQKVGEQAIRCVTEKGEIVAVVDGKQIKGSMERWLSNEVPGRLVRSVIKVTVDGKIFKQVKQVKKFSIPEVTP